MVKAITAAFDSVLDNKQIFDALPSLKSSLLSLNPTPLNRQIANTPITIQKPAMRIKITLFDACLSYKNGNLTPMKRSKDIKTMLSRETPSNKILNARTTLQETNTVLEVFIPSSSRSGIATVATKKSATAKLRTIQLVLVLKFSLIKMDKTTIAFASAPATEMNAMNVTNAVLPCKVISP